MDTSTGRTIRSAGRRAQVLGRLRERTTTLALAAGGLCRGQHQEEDPWTQERIRQLGQAARELAEEMWEIQQDHGPELHHRFGTGAAIRLGLYDLPAIALACDALVIDPARERWSCGPASSLLGVRAMDVARELERWIRRATKEPAAA